MRTAGPEAELQLLMFYAPYMMVEDMGVKAAA